VFLHEYQKNLYVYALYVLSSYWLSSLHVVFEICAYSCGTINFT
jgi:hypothetical protein